MQIPPPPPVGESAGFQGDSSGLTGPAPWSALAIAAFVCALLGFLGVTAILGIILGIAGIIVTGGGQRRGKGLAIAAIPISIVTGLVSLLLVLMVLASVKLFGTIATIMPVFSASAPDRPLAMVEFRKFTSASFDETVSDEQFFAWVDQVTKENGKLTKVVSNNPQGGPRPHGDDGRLEWNLPAKFVNGPATIQIILKQEAMWDLKLDDIAVAGVSPLGSPE